MPCALSRNPFFEKFPQDRHHAGTATPVPSESRNRHEGGGPLAETVVLAHRGNPRAPPGEHPPVLSGRGAGERDRQVLVNDEGGERFVTCDARHRIPHIAVATLELDRGATVDADAARRTGDDPQRHDLTEANWRLGSDESRLAGVACAR